MCEAVTLRRLRPGDESVVDALARRARPRRVTELLADQRTLFVVAFEGSRPIGFVLRTS